MILPDWARAARRKWHYTGTSRPDFADPGGHDTESVWDFPRPPRCSEFAHLVTVHSGDILIAETTASIIVRETASPPTYYVPRSDVEMAHLRAGELTSRCEWKGVANYYHVRTKSALLTNVAWSYPAPFDEYIGLTAMLAFFPHQLECAVDGQLVTAQPGNIYGGWATSNLSGPFKGDPGTELW